MKHTRLAFIVLVLLMTLSFLVIAAVVKRPGANNLGTSLIPEPISYAKPTPGGRFLLVAFGSEEAEKKTSSETMKRGSAEVREKYTVPGIYKNETPPVLVYKLEGYAPDENIYITQDGRSVVRIEGDWWKTKAYPAGARLPADKEKEQLDAPAVSIFRDGVLLKSYPLKEIISSPNELPHSPEHILWPGGAVLNDDKQFLLYTQDSQRVTFNVETGEIITRESMGFGNHFAQITILVTLGLTIAVAVSWAIYFYRGRRKEPLTK